MPLIDSNGRLFGRINLLDALAGAVIVVMIPLAYAAYVLFRPAPAKLIAVEPKRITQGPNRRLQLWGENLRPFMRISLNDIQARTFLIESTRGAEADLPDPIEPGTYDVVLYDYARELSRLPKAVTIIPNAPLPSLAIEATGSFVGLSEAAARAIAAGQRLAEGKAQAEVLSVEPPARTQVRIRAGEVAVGVSMDPTWQTPASIRVSCYPESVPDGSIRCMVPGEQQAVMLGPDALLTFRAKNEWLLFQVSEVHLDPNPTESDVRVRFIGSFDLLNRLKIGDVDSSIRVYSRAHAARVVAVEPPRPAAGQLPVTLAALAAGETGAVRDVVVRVPVERTPNGWNYRNRSVKVGAPFILETPNYIVQGQVISVGTPETPKAK